MTGTRGKRRRERGLALVTMMVVMALLMAVGAAIHTGVLADTEMRGAHGRALGGFYAAEAGINRGMGNYRNLFLSRAIPSQGNGDFDLHSFTLGQRTVSYQLASAVNLATYPLGYVPIHVAAGKPFSGLNASEYRYTALATSQLHAGDIEASLGTEFDVDAIPIFQFLAFYAGDLEIMPGKDMTIHGAIHTNGSLYLSATSSTLTIADLQPTIPTVHVTAAGDVNRNRKDDPSSCTGTVQVSKLADTNHDGSLDLQTLSTCGIESNATLSTWLGSIKAHQPVVSVPTPDSIQRGGGSFWSNANLRIALDANHPDANGLLPIVALDVNSNVDAAQTARLQAFMGPNQGALFYNDIPAAAHDNPTACANADSYCNPNNYTPHFANAAKVYPCPTTQIAGLYGACASITTEPLSTGGVTARRGGFYNNREHAWMRMLNVNLHDLLAWNRAQAVANRFFDPAVVAPNGGIVIYLTVLAPNFNGIATPRLGVRVLGSPSIGTNGVTIVSDQAAFVESNYNIGAVAGEPKQGSAIIGDTINVLSSNWESTVACRNDCQSRQPLASRPALNTTVNAAFISGVDVTSVGNYNGGLENYPRFHESWTGRTLTYRGSFVSLGTPRHNNGAWCGTGAACNMYDPPTRNWDFDTDFQDLTKLPPATPTFFSVQQILFTENFR